MKKRTINTILSLVIILLPCFFVFLFMLLTGNGVQLKSFFPIGNDGEYWWLQISSIIKYGKSLGYFGYNESFAPIGGLGAWNVITYYFYAFIGKIIGWNYYSMVWANIIFLSLALYLLVVITKPNIKEKIVIILVYSFCGIETTLYSMTSLSESFRTSIGIIMVSIIIYLLKREEKVSSWFFILIIIVSLIGMNIFTPFVLFGFVIIGLSINIDNTKLRWGLSLIICLLLLMLSMYINSIFSAKYFVTNNMENLFHLVSNSKGVLEKGWKLVTYIFNKLNSFVEAIHNPQSFSNFFVFYFLIFVLFVIKFFAERDKNKRKVNSICLLLFCGFLIGVIVLYESKETYKIARIVEDCFLPVLLLSTFFTNKKVYFVLIILISLIIWPSDIKRINNSLSEQMESSKKYNEINDLKDTLTNIVFEIDPNKSKWENTIDDYGLMICAREYILAMPTGAGLNLLLNNCRPSMAKYVLVEKGINSMDYLESEIINNGYYCIYTGNQFDIYRSYKYD